MGLFDFIKKTKPSYHLENIPAAQEKAGARKFTRPTAEEIAGLKIGEMVRLFFVLDFETSDGCRAERMWVEISEIDGRNFKGFLTNRPVYIKDVSMGDVVEFSGDNIATVLVSQGFDEKKKALVSKRAIAKGEINWALKDEPHNEMDSGWQLFYGDEDDEYNSDASNIRILTLEDVLSFEPKLEEVFASEHNAFEWDESAMRFVEVKEYHPPE
ncbi:MAG: DUF2185 domain-containing protein [Candidatus Accumulibacter sp.]|jgi:hypothetical protein|nr:DUF2185 domain-containing protein [Accumulibacter sp.]